MHETFIYAKGSSIVMRVSECILFPPFFIEFPQTDCANKLCTHHPLCLPAIVSTQARHANLRRL